MSRDLTIWLLTFAVGAITYSARLSFIVLLGRRNLPPLLAAGLKHVPVAMLTVIVVPAVVFMAPSELRIDPGNIKLVAAITAAAAAWWRQSAVLTITVGMVVLWSLRYVMR